MNLDDGRTSIARFCDMQSQFRPETVLHFFKKLMFSYFRETALVTCDFVYAVRLTASFSDLLRVLLRNNLRFTSPFHPTLNSLGGQAY